MIGIEVKLGIVCSQCNMRNPFMGLRTTGVCFNCNQPLDIKRLLDSGQEGGVTFYGGGMKYYFGAYYDIIYEILALRDEGEQGMAKPGHLYSFEYRRKFPYCPDCNIDLNQAELEAISGDVLTCSHCHAAIPIRQRDESTIQWDQRIDMVVNDRGGGKDLMPPASTQAEVCYCMGCGAALKVDGTKKFVECEHCGSSNQLPDRVWQTVHAIPEMQPFFLVIKENPLLHAEARAQILNVAGRFEDDMSFDFEGAQSFEIPRGERFARLQSEYQLYLQQLLQPENGQLLRSALARQLNNYLFSSLMDAGVVDEQAVLRALENGAPNTRSIIASHPLAPASALAKLVEDSDERIRTLAAGNRNLSADQIGRLAADACDDVRMRIAQRDDLSAETLIKLSDDKNDDVREFAAKDARMPVDVLKKLAKDSCGRVSDAAQANPNFKKGGFFSKLFR